MIIGSCIPVDKTKKNDHKLSLDEALDALAGFGIKSCMEIFYSSEDLWEKKAHTLAKALGRRGMTLLEDGSPFYLNTASRESFLAAVPKLIKLLSISESIGCLNVGVCAGGPNAIYPHPDNRRQKSWDSLKEMCCLIAEESARRGLKARLLFEMVYVTVLWSPDVLARLIDEVASPNIQGHMDIANCLSYDNIYDHTKLIKNAFSILSGKIYSAHIKDIRPNRKTYLPGIHECHVGDGVMDNHTYLECLSHMPADFPVFVEHLHNIDDIIKVYNRVKAICDELNIAFKKEI
jgi:sugar phosphate isomerase/epimerase